MSSDENMVALIKCSPKLTDHLQTEETANTALVMPPHSVSRYDVY